MKILLLSTSDSGGGASIAADRLCQALNEAGITAVLGVVSNNTLSRYVVNMRREKNVFQKVQIKCIRMYSKIINRFFYTSNPILHSMNLYSRIDVKSINLSDFDIVHLHWINDNMISIKDISKIEKKLVWTMHDTWPFCGAEHYPNIWEGDNRFTEAYSCATKPKTTKGLDICKTVWQKKKKYLKNKEIVFISPSNWEKELLRKSSLFHKMQCEVIANVIPKEVFFQKNKNEVRRVLNLSTEKKIICFGAAYNISDQKSIKGGNLLIEALSKLDNSFDYEVLVFGPINTQFESKIHIRSFFTGYIENPKILAALYNAADVFVCPSVIENLPTTCLEAMFCGIPVVAFNTGGIPDIIEHKTTGYLAPLFDTDELANGIKYCIAHSEELSRNAILNAQLKFNSQHIVNQHISLYKSILA